MITKKSATPRMVEYPRSGKQVPELLAHRTLNLYLVFDGIQEYPVGCYYTMFLSILQHNTRNLSLF